MRELEIPKSEGVRTFSVMGFTKILSDGHTHEDLAVVTVEKLQKLTNSKSTDFWTLMEMAVRGEVVKDAEEGRPQEAPKKAEEKTLEPSAVTPKVKSCCGSKGARHLKTCKQK